MRCYFLLAAWLAFTVPVVAAQDYVQSDKDIERRLHLIFSRIDDLHGVKATAYSGVVQLSGQVASTEAIERAERIAAAVQDVEYIDNDLRLVRGWRQLIRPSIHRISERLETIVGRLPLIVLAVLVVTVFVLLARGARRWQAPYRWVAKNRLARDVLRQVAPTLVVLLGILAALELLEATALVGAVLGAAGLLGIALGFAFRDIAENYLASILLGIRRPFSANDHVVINKEHEGKVVRLTTRETVLMTLEGNHLRLPNSLVYKAVILNYTRNPLRLFQFATGIGPDVDLVDAQHVALSALSVTPGVATNPKPFSRVQELGDWNVTILLFAWVDQRESDWFKVRSEAIRRTKDALDAAGIAMPVPTHQVNVQQPEAIEASRVAKAAPKELAQQQAHEVAPDFVLEEQIEKDKAQDKDVDLLTSNSDE